MVIVVASRKYGIGGRRFQFNDPLGPISSSAALHVFVYAHGSNTPSSTLEPHHPLPPPHEFRARTCFRVVLYLCASIKPIPTPTLPLPPLTTAYLRVVTRVSVREIPKGASLFRLIATNSAQTTSTPLVDTDLLLSPLLFLAGFTPSPRWVCFPRWRGLGLSREGSISWVDRWYVGVFGNANSGNSVW